MVVCEHCSTTFDALISLSDVPAVTSPLNLDNTHARPDGWLVKFFMLDSTAFWGTGIGICLLGILLQIYVYHFQTASQDAQLRPWLSKLCPYVHCTVPEYRNIAEISVLQGELLIQEDNTFQFTTTLINQANFAQPLPAIKLSFVDLAGNVLAYRIFFAADYLPDAQSQSIDSNATRQVELHIAPVPGTIGGYYFDLV